MKMLGHSFIKMIILCAFISGTISVNQLEISGMVQYPGGSSWAQAELEEAMEYGFIPDYFFDDFGKVITRAEFSQVVMEVYYVMGSGFYELVESPFSDTDSSYAAAAYSLGIVNGMGEGIFAPEAPITREQVCVMLVRTIHASGLHLLDESTYEYGKTYEDRSRLSSWAEESVRIMNSLGIFNGTGSKLEPDQYLTREQALLLALRTYKMSSEITDDFDHHVEDMLVSLIPVYSQEGYDEAGLREAAYKGLSLPVLYFPESGHVPGPYDVITYERGLTGQELHDSLSHKGFGNLDIELKKDKYTWFDFFDEYSVTISHDATSIALLGKDLGSVRIEDDYMEERGYYRDMEGVYYQVTEYILPEDSTYGSNMTGTSIATKDLPGMPYIGMNPLILDSGEVVRDCFITKYDGQWVVYLETLLDEDLKQSFISLETGLAIRRLKFDDRGLVEYEESLISISEGNHDSYDFYPESGIDYTDMTLFIFGFTNSELMEPFVGAVGAYTSDEPFKLTIQVDGDQTFDLYAKSFEESIDHSLISVQTTDMFGQEVTLISYQTGERFVTVCPEKEVVEMYGSSISENKVFNFLTTRLVGFKEEDGLYYYKFADAGLGSVSGMTDIYEYIADSDGNLVGIDLYSLEEGVGTEIFGQVTSYMILDSQAGQTELYDYPDTYEVIDHGPNSHYDGEHPPYWFWKE